MRIVAGLDKQSSGEVLLDGKRIDGPGADRGMVFQSLPCSPADSARQRLLRAARVQPAAQPTTGSRRYLLYKVGLRGFENHYPAALGRHAATHCLARALANNPRMLLMDEPFGALDHQTRELMQELLLGIWENGEDRAVRHPRH